MANALIHETSPYLLQHAHNPVDWHPWGDVAFEKARLENKPVLVSIGYATCHWCHVMERECFENIEVAEYMNENFVCIKVDREEHPDVDHFYMDALMALQQSGGWPLNMFVNADRQPFYGGTYFPPHRIYNRPSWMEILEAVKLTWAHKKNDIDHQSQQLINYLQQTYLYESPKDFDNHFIDINLVVDNIKKHFDAVYGGFSIAPKFPQFNVLQFLITVAKLKEDKTASSMAVYTIKKMLNSGIYDVLEGGICRYATDQEWKIPHFEKMLYDNAGLITTLSQLATIHDDKQYRNVIEQTIQYCNNTWLKDGLYMSAIDADSEGEEGKYYVWNYDELHRLNAYHNALADYYAISQEGNWEEGKHILHAHYTENEILEKYQFIPRQWQMMKQQFHLELLSKRKQRTAPIIDTKYLLSQNAMMLVAFINAYKSMGNVAYKEQSLVLMNEIKVKFINRNEDYIGHLFETRNRNIYAKLDDLAYLLQAYILMFTIHSDVDLLEEIDWILKYIDTHFSDENGLMYYFSDVRQKDVLVRKIEVFDAAIASSNAIMAENLWWIGQIQSNVDYLSRANKIIATQQNALQRYPIGLSSFARVAVIIKDFGSVIKKNNIVTDFEHNIFYKQFVGAKLLFCAEENSTKSIDSTSIKNDFEVDEYQECSNGTCKMPVKSVFQLF